MNISSVLDSIANRLEAKGMVKEAYQLDVVANELDARCQYCGGKHGPWEGPMPVKGDIVMPKEVGRLSAPKKDGTFTVLKITPNSNAYFGKNIEVVTAEGSSGLETFPLDCVKPVKK